MAVYRSSLLLIGIGLILAGIVAGCAPVPSTKTPTAGSNRAVADDEVVTLVFWHNHPEWKDRVQAILDVFEEEHPNIKIALEEIPASNYGMKRNTALAAGEAPDLIGFAPGLPLRTAMEAGHIHDLTELVNIEGLTPSAQEAVKVDGKVYAVPSFGAYTVGLYYHKDVFEELGLTPPATWEELMEVAEVLKAAAIAPMMAPAQDGVVPFFLYMLAASSIMGADGVDRVRTGEVKLTDPEVLPATQFLRDLYDISHEGALGTPYIEGKALFAHGHAAMMQGRSADYAGFIEVNPDVNLSVVPFPSPEGVGKPSTLTGLEMPTAINSKTEHLDEAVIFLQWMISPKAGQMVADTITFVPIEGVVPSENETLQEMLESAKSNDVRVWYEFPETGRVGDVIRENVQLLFTDAITPEEFAQLVQDSIEPSGN